MPVRFAINGLGRIGRALARIALERPGLELAAVNDLAATAQLAHLLQHDSVHRRFAREVRVDGENLVVDGRPIPVSHQGDVAAISWPADGRPERPLVVVDATGKCLTPELAGLHLRPPVEKVLVSANAEGLDVTLCLGVNHRDYDPAKHHLISASSCTTNCAAPIAWVLHREFGIESALLNTVHSYNNDQRLLSYPHRDPRRAREAAMNMIPTTTSASRAVALILPELAGLLDGLAVRVPTPNVSLVDLVVKLAADPGVEEVNRALTAAAEGELAGVLAVTGEELVSSDYIGDPHSAIVDLPLTQKAGNGLVRVVAWYDNEWGHASRLADLLELIGGGSGKERDQ